MFIDTHCHLDFPDFDPDREEVIRKSRAEGIGYIINVSSSIKGAKDSLELSHRHDFIYAAVGIHPHEADACLHPDIRGEIKKLAGNKKVVAIGEIGLDYYRHYSLPKNQKDLFVSLLALASELKLPAIIHSRQAQEDTLRILKENPVERIVLHCFSGDEAFLAECLSRGYYLSFTCNITYKKSGDLRRIVLKAPLERIFLETDAPFLPPEGARGKRNDPWQVKAVAEEIARLKGLSTEEVARVTTENALAFFSLEAIKPRVDQG
ncbi:MAG: TatD family hydrolase [Candidatus Omnitrophota bacterium]